MLIITDSDLRSFEAWSGGRDRLERLVELENDGKINLAEIEYYIEECFPEGLTETNLNDFLWFEMDEVFQTIYGFDMWDDEEEEEE